MRWNFCSYFEQIADPPNFLRKLALKFCLRQKSLKLRHSSNWAANLFKIWQNSNAALSVAYLFFIIYQKSIKSQFLCYECNVIMHKKETNCYEFNVYNAQKMIELLEILRYN